MNYSPRYVQIGAYFRFSKSKGSEWTPFPSRHGALFRRSH